MPSAAMQPYTFALKTQEKNWENDGEKKAE